MKKFILKKNVVESRYIIKEKFNEKQKRKIEEILEYVDSELNSLRYNKAIKYDKRGFSQYYFSLLKLKHLFLKIFNKKDYNSRFIKILLFFFNFIYSFTINALFFRDETMHKIYLEGGDFNFIYQLPQIIYSTIITFILMRIINFLGLSQDNILKLKRETKLNRLGVKAKRTIEKLRVKFTLFFVITFIFIVIFWYYLGCFCAVYQNTQFHLIKDTLISFGISNITPFGINLLPGLLRIHSLSKYNKRKKYLYNFSKFLQKL